MSHVSKPARWALYVGLACTVLTVVVVGFLRTTAERPLTAIRDIHHWNAANGSPRPIRLRATVTYYDPAWRMLNVQAGDLGLFLDPDFKQMDIHPGTVVDIEGMTDLKSVISRGSIKLVGMGSLPTPIETTIPEVATGRNSGLVVKVKGVVRWAKMLDSRITVKIASGIRTLNVRVLDTNPELLRIPSDSIIEVTGVASPPAEAPRTVGEVFVNDGSAIKVLQAGSANLFLLPLTPMEGLNSPRASEETAHAVHVRQRVVGRSSDGDWVIGTATEQVHLRPLERLMVQPGDMLDVVGFPSMDGALVALVDAAVHVAEQNGSQPYHTLTTAAEVTRLDPADAAGAIPVRLKASVTFFDSWWQLLFVQDRSGGVYIETVPPNSNLRVGDVVLIEGETRSGGFIPDVARPTIKVVGHGPLPAAVKASRDDLLQGRYDSERVEVTGVVRGVAYNPDQKRMVLDVVSGNTLVKAQLLTPDKVEDPTALIDNKVRLTGIAGTLLNQNMQMVGISLFVQDKTDLKVLEAGPEDPFALPSQEIGSLLRYRVPGHAQHRVHISGVVLMQDGKTLYVRDASGVIAVRMMTAANAHPGNLVHAVGFIAPGETRPVLASALAVVRGNTELPDPPVIAADAILKGGYDSDLVTVEGTVLSSTRSPRGWELLLQSEAHTFNAVLVLDPIRDVVPRAEPGSLVRITGVAETQANPAVPDASTLSFRIHMRSRQDLKVLSRPPWWTLERFLVLAAMLVAIAGVALAWVVMLKRQVRRQTALIQQQTVGLLRAEKLASIGQLVTGVAHELNNPLAAVIGYSDLLMDDIASAPHRDKLEKLGREARRMKRIIDNLLHFARPSTTGRGKTDLEEVIRGALSLHEANLHSLGIKVEMSFQQNLPRLELDEDQLKQVFLNLFSNSVQALTDASEKHIWVVVQIDGAHVVVRFRDTGRGFDDVHKAFDPFYTTKPVGQGPGLGLSICYGIIKEHGGRISVQNLQPTGAMVVIKLPITDEKQMAAQAES